MNIAVIVASFAVGFVLGAVVATVFIAVALAGSLDFFGRLSARKAPPEPAPNISELTCAISDRAAHVVSLLHNGPMTSEKRAAVEEEARGLAQAATNLHYWARQGTRPLGRLLERTETE